MVEDNGNNRQTVSDNGCWRGGVKRQEVECEAEDPTGNSFFLRLLVFFLRGLNHMAC
jgi:hypothetical protein